MERPVAGIGSGAGGERLRAGLLGLHRGPRSLTQAPGPQPQPQPQPQPSKVSENPLSSLS
jgi:hypothetical protein